MIIQTALPQVISEEQFKIRFDGKLHSVFVDTFLVTLTSINEVIQEINETLNTINKSNNRVRVKMTAIQQGSFEVCLDIMQSIGKALPSAQHLNDAASILSILTGIFTIKKFLGARKPEKVEKRNNNYEITNEAGDVLIVESMIFNFYEKSENIPGRISRTFSTLDNDHSITGLEILDKNNQELFVAHKEEFRKLSEFVQPGGAQNEKTIIEYARLALIDPGYDNPLRWCFYYKGDKISAEVLDDDILLGIVQGESFAKGDILEADLQIKQEYSPLFDMFINKSYEVIKVHKHLRRSERFIKPKPPMKTSLFWKLFKLLSTYRNEVS